MTAPVTYNPFEYHRDPYPLYRRLRDEAPLCHNADLGCWTLSRFADVQAAARDWQGWPGTRRVCEADRERAVRLARGEAPRAPAFRL
jgi:cytochrome P450